MMLYIASRSLDASVLWQPIAFINWLPFFVGKKQALVLPSLTSASCGWVRVRVALRDWAPNLSLQQELPRLPPKSQRKAAEAASSPPCGASANASDPPQPEGCEADTVSLPSPGSGEEGLRFNSEVPAKPTASSATVGAPRGAVVAVRTDARPAAKEKPRKRQLGKLPMPDDAKDYLGCAKCKYTYIGCATCRRKVGLVLNADETAWTWAT